MVLGFRILIPWAFCLAYRNKIHGFYSGMSVIFGKSRASSQTIILES